MRIDPLTGNVVWRLPLKAAWLGLARSGRDWRDTVWASGGGTNRVYRLAWQGGARWSVDTVTLADSSAQLFAAGLALVPTRGLVAVVGNLSDSLYLIDATTLARRGAVAVGHRPYTAVAVVRLEPARMRVAGLIPVGWYPTALAVSPDGRALYVANGKGARSGANPDGTYIGNVITGSVSMVPVPDAATLTRYTREA